MAKSSSRTSIFPMRPCSGPGLPGLLLLLLLAAIVLLPHMFPSLNPPTNNLLLPTPHSTASPALLSGSHPDVFPFSTSFSPLKSSSSPSPSPSSPSSLPSPSPSPTPSSPPSRSPSPSPSSPSSPSPSPSSPSSPPSPSPIQPANPPPAPPAATPGGAEPSSSNPPQDNHGNKRGMSAGKKAGIAVGVLLATAAVGFAFVIYRKRTANIRRESMYRREMEMSTA